VVIGQNALIYDQNSDIFFLNTSYILSKRPNWVFPFHKETVFTAFDATISCSLLEMELSPLPLILSVPIAQLLQLETKINPYCCLHDKIEFSSLPLQMHACEIFKPSISNAHIVILLEITPKIFLAEKGDGRTVIFFNPVSIYNVTVKHTLFPICLLLFDMGDVS